MNRPPNDRSSRVDTAASASRRWRIAAVRFAVVAMLMLGLGDRPSLAGANDLDTGVMVIKAAEESNQDLINEDPEVESVMIVAKPVSATFSGRSAATRSVLICHACGGSAKPPSTQIQSASALVMRSLVPFRFRPRL